MDVARDPLQNVYFVDFVFCKPQLSQYVFHDWNWHTKPTNHETEVNRRYKGVDTMKRAAKCGGCEVLPTHLPSTWQFSVEAMSSSSYLYKT